MSWEWVFLGIVATIVIIMIVFRKNPIVEKYWKYTLILLPAVILIILSLINKRKGTTTTSDSVAKTIEKVKDDLTETNMVAAIKVSAANQQQKDKVEKLEEIKKNDDQKERLKQLAAMMGGE